MTNQHRATPEQWDFIERSADGRYPSCILELRARIEALEAAQPHQDKMDRLIAIDRDDPANSPVERIATDTFRALCAELADELQGYKVAHPMHCRALLKRARAALTQPEPAALTDEELLASVRHFYGDQAAADMGAEDDLRTARAVLARWGTP
jgi:hypothetical protein